MDSLPTVFVIGLPGRYRSDELEHDLSELGVAARRSDGVLVQDSDRMRYVDDKSTKVLMRRTLTNAEIGCALAHRRVYASFLAELADDWCIVCEDDASQKRFDLQTIKLLDDVFARESGAIVIPLFTLAGGAIVAGAGLTGGVAQALVPPTTATAYALNRLAASEMLANELVRHAADWPIEATTACRFFVLAENSFEPSGAESTIGSRQSGREPRSRTTMRRLGAVLHLRWFRYMSAYGSYRAYVLHELVRGPAYRLGARNGGHLVAAPGLLKVIATLGGPPRPGSSTRSPRIRQSAAR